MSSDPNYAEQISNEEKARKDFGEYIRARREQLGHTREQVATLSGISIGTIKNLEVDGISDRPRSKTLTAIAHVLEIDQRFILKVAGLLPC